MQALLERPANGHRFAHAFHLRGERGVGLREFLERKPRHFGHDVINRRLEARGGFARDVVFDFVEQVADGEFGGDFRDGKSRGLGRERGAAADARVHLDDDHAAVVGVDAELDVRAAGLDAHGADDGEALVAHDLKFLVSQRLDGRDGDAIAGVDAHGVEVFDGADDDAVVGLVAHHFHLVFLPAEQGFFDEDLGDGREVHAALGEFVELLAVVGDAPTRAAESECGANDEWETADFFGHSAGVFHVVRRSADGHVEANAEHELFEGFAVLAFVNGLGFGADHFNSVFVQHAGAMQGHGGVERGLAAGGGEQRECVCGGFVRSDAERCGRDARAPRNRNTHALHLVQFADDDFFHGFGRDWLDVGAIGELRVGHDGGRVGVHENDAVALFLEGFAGLRAGIVELARLADEDRSGADDEDGVDVGSSGHADGYLSEVGFRPSDLRCASPVIGTKRTGSVARFSSRFPCLLSSISS